MLGIPLGLKILEILNKNFWPNFRKLDYLVTLKLSEDMTPLVAILRSLEEDL